MGFEMWIRGFLTLVGLTYVALGGLCLARPEQTARSIGFELITGAGVSEYMVVYGGLELALGLLFLQPWLRPERLPAMLEACFLIHLCLVAVRSWTLLTIPGIPSFTKSLAVGEWCILILSAACLWWARSATAGTSPVVGP
jgi:hypothetical protein